MNSRVKPKLTLILPLFLIGITGIICYYNSFSSFFLSDDFVLIALYSKLGAWGLWVNQQHGNSLFFRPVLSIISFLDYQLWGLQAWGYHLTNFLFHGVNALWVGGIATLLLSRQFNPSMAQKFIPYLSGFIFLLLPSHTEPVSWISARTDVISTFFALSSLGVYLFYKINKASYFRYLSLILFLLGLLSKEAIVSFPGIIACYECYEYLFHDKYPKNIKYHFGIFGQYMTILLIYFALRYWKINTLVGGYGEKIHLQFNLQQLLKNIAIYPTRSLLPPFQQSNFEFWLFSFFGLLAILIASLIISRFLHSKTSKIPQILIFLVLAFYIAVLPAINVMVSMIDTQGERYLYFASGFSAIFLAISINTIILQSQVALIASSILLLYFGLSTYSLNQNWKVAGDISKDILESIQNIQPNAPALVTSLPDNYQGAYIYRTGLIQALYLFDNSNQFNIRFMQQATDKNFEKVAFKTELLKVMMNHEVLDQSDGVIVENLSDNSYQCQLSNTQATFLPWKKYSFQTEDYQITDLQRSTYQFELNNPSNIGDILLYSAGTIQLKSKN